MKERIYIATFTFLGALSGLLLQGGLEMWALGLVALDYERFAEVFWWQNWEVIRSVGIVTLPAIGLVLGYFAGKRYWNILYVEERYGKPRF